ncbi:BglG family transcription antiterminator [Clostridium tyrobutyricum]|uniref:BglG family transcription antiterminator n=1 Tax=Clostridium tyrobutyricum TaxID=1519 RepID=UPI00073D7260|nr:PRD domain-containing protein [Clostridium tyrobutyricum]
MHLSQRQADIMQVLLRYKEYQPVKSIANNLHCSVKTIRNDLKIIENEISSYNINIIKKPGIGIKLHSSNKERMEVTLITELNKMKKSDTESTEYRRIKILLDLLNNSNQMTSIQKLSEKYYISKTSIVNDLKQIEEYLKKYNINLERGREGTRIIGDEVNIRNAIVSLIEDLISYKEAISKSEISNRLDKLTLNELFMQFGKDNVKLIQQIIEKSEEKLGYTIGEPYYINIITHILILIQRRRTGKVVSVKNNIGNIKICDNKVYKVCTFIAKSIKIHFNVKLPEEEITFIYQYLISSGIEFLSLKFENENLMLETNSASKQIAKEMIKLFSDILKLDLNIDKNLYKDLVMHLKPMLNRIKYGINIKNQLIDNIKKELPMAFTLLNLVMLIIKRKFKFNYISQDEIGYLAVYFQAALEQSMSQKKVIVVCSSGIGTSHLLKNRIKHSFPDWDIVDVVSVNYLNSSVDLDNIDFIISTVKIKKAYKPVAYVTALFNDTDVKNVTELLIKDSVKTNNNKFKIINEYLRPEYINIVDNLKCNDDEAAYVLLKNIYGREYIKYNTFKDFITKLSIEYSFQVYINNENCTNISCIGMNVLKKKHSKSIIQLIIICKEDYNVMIKLITEIFELFNNKNLINKIYDCSTKKQIINLFNIN